jgi:peptidoglycan-N-acetylglucosamine deacetylase
MKNRLGFSPSSMSPAEKTGIVAFSLAALLLLVDVRAAVAPLALFVAMCVAAPFFPAIPFFLPTTSRGNSGHKAVALTFDDGPDPATTPPLLDLLARHELRATFFVTGERAEKHPDLVRKILSGGHAVGNHTYSHDNFIMLKGSRRLKEEIERAGEALEKLGVASSAFRPPVGIVNPGLRGVLEELGMYAVTFSLRPGDAGNRRIGRLAERILKRVRQDDIVLLHEKIPGDPNRLFEWLSEMDRLFRGLKEKGFSVLPLSDLIGKPVSSTKRKAA